MLTSLFGLLRRLLSRRRSLRRTTIVGPLIDAFSLRGVVRRIESRATDAQVLGPDEFAPYVRSLTPLSPSRDSPGDLSFDYVILRQNQISSLNARLLMTLRTSYACLFASSRYALFGARGSSVTESPHAAAVARRIEALTEGAPPIPAHSARPGTANDRAVLVTTFNRPAALRRSLPQIAALGHAVLVVDDGSVGALAAENLSICRHCDARYLPLPANRGLSTAVNVGLSYLLADRRLEWISYLQDDVDVDPSLLEGMRVVEDRLLRPILTGYDADEHPAEHEERIGGLTVRMKCSSPAVHLHAHVDYWSGVLPIPTEYLGAPRRRWEASLEDYWIVNHAPASAGRRGVLVTCLPGLVRTFLWHHADSTWGNPNLPDPPLTRQPMSSEP